ncbi:hypothetical protein ACFL6U_15220 [Planctomycetota bacterium]
MDPETRHQRLRNLVRQLNRQRKQRGKQIDILCNDLIEAQRDFIQRLGTISMTASFYQSLLGLYSHSDVLDTAGRFLQEILPETRIVFCLPQDGQCLLHRVVHAAPKNMMELEQHFDPETIDAIAKAQTRCDVDAMVSLGLQMNPSLLAEVTAITIPLIHGCLPQGFILLTRTQAQTFKSEELIRAEALTGGLAQALSACPVASPTSED